MAIRRSTPGWVWLPANPLGGAGGGAYSKLFRNDALPAADLLAREVLQNSWDAALIHELSDAPAFRFCFRFVTLKGAAKARFLQTLDFESILERRQILGSDRDFPDGETVATLGKQRQPLHLLYLEDYGTHGMYGDPKTTLKSHLYKALYILGSTSKDESRASQGGSFGFGKSAFIGSSGLRSVVAHTQFAPQRGDAASQRLIGFTWWGEHEIGGKAFEGRAMFGLPGKAAQSGALPLVDRQAASMAASLGMPKRSAVAGHRGTTVMIVDPVVGPEEVCAAVERYWWPALEDHLMDVTIETDEGETLVPRPRAQKNLVSFVKAYGIAAGLKEPKPSSNERLASNKWRADSQGTKYGALALVIDKNSGTLDGSVDADPIDSSKPVVALIRGPRMVIEYKTFQSRLPIRGVYIASPEIDDYLREVEPPAHNTWDNVRSQQVDERAREVAKSVLARIRRSVQEFADEFAPPPSDVPTDLPLFGSLLSGLIGGRGFGPNLPPRPGGHEGPILTFRGAKPDRRKRADEGMIVVERSLSMKIPNDSKWENAKLDVTIEASIAQDLDATTSDPVKVTLHPPDHFVRVDPSGLYSGTVSPGSEVVFTVTTAPYPEDRSLLILPKAALHALPSVSGDHVA